MSFSLSEYTKIYVGWASPQIPLGELTALHRSPSWLQGGRFAAGGEWRGREGLRGGGREGKGGMGKRGKRGSWGK